MGEESWEERKGGKHITYNKIPTIMNYSTIPKFLQKNELGEEFNTLFNHQKGTQDLHRQTTGQTDYWKSTGRKA